MGAVVARVHRCAVLSPPTRLALTGRCALILLAAVPPSSCFHRLQLLGCDLISMRGPNCIAAFLVSSQSLRARGVDAHQLRLQLSQVLHGLETRYGAALRQLNERHQAAIEDMIKNDGIRQQMADEQKRRDGDEEDTNPLAHARTVPLLRHFEHVVRRIMDQEDVGAQCMRAIDSSNLTCENDASMPLSSPGVIGAYLVVPSAPTSSTSTPACTVLLSRVSPAHALLNIAGPSNASLWSTVSAYACAVGSTSSSRVVALSFPLASPPLLVHLRRAVMPHPHQHACLISYEIGSVSDLPRAKESKLPGAHFLSATEAVLDAEPLLADQHPVAIESRQYPSACIVVRDESQLPAWHWRGGARGECKPDEEEKTSDDPAPSHTASAAPHTTSPGWQQMHEAARILECAFEIDDADEASVLPVPSAEPPQRSPASISDIASTISLGAADSPLPAMSPSPNESDRASPLADAVSETDARETDQQTSASAPLEPRAPNAPREVGAASNRRRKLHAVKPSQVPPSASGLKPHPPDMPRPHPYAESHALVAELGLASSPVPPLPFSHVRAPSIAKCALPVRVPTSRAPSVSIDDGVDLSMDTPRLATEAAPNTARGGGAAAATDERAREHATDRDFTLPPIERRNTDDAHTGGLERAMKQVMQYDQADETAF